MASTPEKKDPRDTVATIADARLRVSVSSPFTNWASGDLDDDAFRLAPMPEIGATLSERYELQRVLGAGAYGQVFSAWDHVRGKLVALKVLRDARPESLLQFKQEFRALSELSHRNLVHFLKLGRSENVWYIVMEQINGAPITVSRTHTVYSTEQRHAAMETTIANVTPIAPPGHGALAPAFSLPAGALVTPLLDVDTLRDRLLQLADGLLTLHRFGVIHCDLKPSNVMVDDTGRVVILDFGVARYTKHIGAHHQQIRAYAGTRPYMAPEITNITAAHPSLDWFAVGMMLAEMLTSLAPAMLANATYAQQCELFTAAAEQHPDYAELFELAALLLHPAPEKRGGFAELVHRCHKGEGALPTALNLGRAYVFVGRDEELDTLEAAWQRFSNNEATIMIVEGEGGIGKSTLCGEFLRRIAFRDAPPIILLARCRNDELLGYRAFDELVDGIAAVLKTLPEDAIATLRPYCSAALVELFPTLSPFAFHDDDSGTPPPEDPLYALRQLIAQLARLRKLVIWVEDVHQADRDSLRWFARIFAPGDCPEVFLLLSQRPRPGEPLADGIDIDTLGYAVPTLRLRGLAENVAEKAVDSWLPPDLDDRDNVIRNLTALGKGHPYVLRELCRDSERVRSLSSGTTLTQLLRTRIRRLPPHVFDTLVAISTGFEPVSRRVLRHVTGLSASALDGALEYLEEHVLIWKAATVEDEHFEPIHHSVSETCLSDAPMELIQRLHDAHAQAGILELRPQMRPAAIVAHLVRAGRSTEAESYADAIGDAAIRSGAYEVAAQMYDLLLQIAEDQRRPASAVVRERAIECRLRTGRGIDAATLLESLADEMPPEQARALRRRAAEALVLSGHIDSGLAMNAAASPPGFDEPTSKIPSLLALGKLENDLHKRLVAIKDIGPRRILNESETAQIDTYRILGIDLGMIDAVRGFQFTMREVNLSIGTNDPARIVRSLSGYCAFTSMSGGKKAERARAYMEIAKDVVKKVDDQVTHEWLNICEGVLDYHRGEYRKGWDRIKVSYDWMYANASNQHMILSWLEMHRLFCAQVLGDTNSLRAAYYGQIVEARARHNRLHEASITLIGSTTWLIDDAPDAGKAAVDRIQIARTSGRYQLYDYLHMRAACERTLYKQLPDADYDEALRECRKLEVTLLGRSVQLCRHEGRFLHARLLFARAKRDGYLRRTDSLLLEGIGRSLSRSENMAMSAGWGHCILASLFYLRGEKARASWHIQRGIDIYEQGDVNLFAQIARLAGHRAGLITCERDPLTTLRELGVVAPVRLASSYHPALLDPR